MKIAEVTRSVTRSGAFLESEFKIAANAKAFGILSSKIYTDVPLAIVRELSTNAYDAHVDAGNASRPFRVHLPNAFEPFFSIRDYGTGLSPDSVRNVYTTYFSSTRSDSNEFVGALGLGSKSPFAYTDQFTVTSYFNGVKYSFSAYKNEHGRPTLALLNESPTDEHNGLEVHIAIKNSDFTSFSIAARRVYRFFVVKPEVVGNVINFASYEPLFSGTNYELYDERSEIPSTICVVMGQICYTVPTNAITSPIGYRGRLVLHAEMGEYSIAASREELHCDNRTLANIQKKINEAIEDINKRIDADLNDEPILFRRLTRMLKYKEILNLSRSNTRIPGEAKDKYSISRCYLSSRRDHKLYIHDYAENYIDANLSCVFIEQDVEVTQTTRRRLRHLMIGNSASTDNYYLVKISDLPSFEQTFGPTHFKLSELPAVPREQIKRTPGSFIKLLEPRSKTLLGAWKTCASPIEPNNSCVVVRRPNNHIVIANSEYSPWALSDFLKLLNIKYIYGVSENRLKKFQNEYGLKTLDEIAKNFINNFVNNLTEIDIAKFCGKSGQIDTSIAKAIANVSDISKNFVALCLTQGKITSEHARLMSLYNISVQPKRDYVKEFWQRYPMLQYCLAHRYNSDATTEEILSYMNLVENNNV